MTTAATFSLRLDINPASFFIILKNHDSKSNDRTFTLFLPILMREGYVKNKVSVLKTFQHQINFCGILYIKKVKYVEFPQSLKRKDLVEWTNSLLYLEC